MKSRMSPEQVWGENRIMLSNLCWSPGFIAFTCLCAWNISFLIWICIRIKCRASKTCLSAYAPPSYFCLLNFPMQFLFVRRWFHMWCCFFFKFLFVCFLVFFLFFFCIFNVFLLLLLLLFFRPFSLFWCLGKLFFVILAFLVSFIFDKNLLTYIFGSIAYSRAEGYIHRNFPRL